MNAAELRSYLNDLDCILAILLASDLEKEKSPDSESLSGQSRLITMATYYFSTDFGTNLGSFKGSYADAVKAAARIARNYGTITIYDSLSEVVGKVGA